MKPRIAFFGPTIVSADCNGAATYYRGIIKALAARGYDVTLFEPDVFEGQRHRYVDDPSWATVVVYPGNPCDTSGVNAALDAAADADILIKASGVGVFDQLLDAALPTIGHAHTQHVFWDGDGPATLDRLAASAFEPLLEHIPRYDLILTYGGGTQVVEAYKALGARACVPVYNALDPEEHYPCPPDPRFAGDLGFLGSRRPGSEARVEQWLFATATMLPRRHFVLGGNGWHDKPMPSNVSYVGQVRTSDHNAFNSTPRAVLNISCHSTTRYGFSPASRVFEAAGAGACLITDDWRGLATFFEPGSEVLVAYGAEHVAAYVETLDEQTARQIGHAARARVLAEHTYEQRAETLDALLDIRVRA